MARCFEVISGRTVSVRSFLDGQNTHCSSAQRIDMEHSLACKLSLRPESCDFLWNGAFIAYKS